jgi:hypothetical protein
MSIIHHSCHSDESDDYMPIDDLVGPNNDFYDIEEYVLDMLYDNALDDGPIFLDEPPCLTILTNSWEDKNDKLIVCEDTLIYESPILILNSSNHNIVGLDPPSHTRK